MQRLYSTAVSTSLLLAGLYLLYLELFVDPVMVVQVLIVGAFVAAIGAAGLFCDFIVSMSRDQH